ncbi:hypothetical protein AB0L75_39685 [Streptomyces sp. NPDC052101]|uniref:hypothetical protein n=1 Tax=Streptomyces sp. NPDC052101 TaxID=3155763 RepID=UPI0034174991
MRRFRDTDLDELLASARDRRPNGVLEPFKAYLNARFSEAQGQVSGTRLLLKVQARGYRGSRQVVRKHLAALRAGTAEPVRADIPSPRKITSWIMRLRETLTGSQDERLLQVRPACQDITRACDLARALSGLVRHQRGYLLLEWIRQAEQDAPKPIWPPRPQTHSPASTAPRTPPPSCAPPPPSPPPRRRRHRSTRPVPPVSLPTPTHHFVRRPHPAHMMSSTYRPSK